MNTRKPMIMMMLIVCGLAQAKLSTNDPKEAYDHGHTTMQSKEWSAAIEAFEVAAKSERLKAASMYWQAYSHYQLRQRAQAKRLLERLIRQHRDSQWADDAKVLLFEHGDGEEAGIHQEALDEELKLFTLQQSLFNNPEKALPKVYEMLEKSDSERVKMNAIQLLGLSDQEEVADYLYRFIESEQNLGLQHQAIQMLSLRDSQNSREKLAALYDQSADVDLKAAIIQGFIHHDDSTQLIGLLNKERDPDLQMSLIRMLGIKGESAALKKQYRNATGDHKRAILEALGLTGDADYLYEVIEQERDPQIRQQAIQSLIMVDDDQLGHYLTELYQKASDSEEKDVIAGVMLATDVDPQAIIGLIDDEDNTERRQTLLSTLMAMDEVDALRQVYAKETDRETKAAIIRHLGVMDATDALMQMYQADPELAGEPAFFEAFGLTSGELNTDFLMDRFKEGDEDIKQAVLNALMMQDNVDAMVQLLKDETDHETKKQIIRMISITDADALLDAIED